MKGTGLSRAVQHRSYEGYQPLRFTAACSAVELGRADEALWSLRKNYGLQTQSRRDG
jgi:hypothetical protein